MTKLPKKQKKYIDIRLHLSSEIEDYGPDDTYEHFEIAGVERLKFKGIEEDQLDGLAEHVAQSDHHQIYLFSAITTALDTEGVHEL